MVRTLKDKAIDNFLTIYLINDAFSRRKVRFLSETKLQKLIFLSEKSMIDERKKGFSYYFIKLTHGPYSEELRNTLNKFLQTRFLNDFGLKPTHAAKFLLEDFQHVVCRNEEFFEKIIRINNDFATMDLQLLLRKIYSMPWGRGNRTIADLKPRTPMLYPMEPHIVKEKFEITNNEAEDMLMNFDLEAIRDLSEAARDAREGRWRSYEQVFSNL